MKHDTKVHDISEMCKYTIAKGQGYNETNVGGSFLFLFCFLFSSGVFSFMPNFVSLVPPAISFSDNLQGEMSHV